MDRKIGIALILSAIDKASPVITAMVHRDTERLRELQQKSQKYADQSFRRAGQFAAGGAVLAAPIYAAADAAVEFEKGMMGVRRQVNGLNTPESLKEIKKEILDLSTTLPVAPTEIEAMYTEAAKNGVAREALKSFTQDITELSTALELMPQEASQQMSGLRLVFHKQVTDIRDMGDAINYLDDRFQSTGAGIIEVMNRSGGVMQKYMSFEQSAALSSTFLALQETPERASTGITELFTTLTAATVQSKKAQQAFQYLGLDARKLQKNMTVDAMGTIVDVLERINRIPKEKQAAVLSTMFGQEHVAKITKLASGVDELKRELAAVNGAQKGSMNKEYQIRLSSTAAQMQLLSNKTNNLSITTGDQLLPKINELVDKIGKLVGKLTVWTEKHPTLTKYLFYTVAAASALLFVLAGLNFVVGTLAATKALLIGRAAGVTAALTVESAAAAATTTATTATTTATVGLTIAQRALNMAMRAVPWIAIAMIAIEAIILIKENWGEISAWFEEQWEKVKKVFNAVWDWLVDFGKGFYKLGRDMVNFLVDGIVSVAMAPVNAVLSILDEVKKIWPFGDDIDFKAMRVTSMHQLLTPLQTLQTSQAAHMLGKKTQVPAISTVKSYSGSNMNFSPVIHLNGSATNQDAQLLNNTMQQQFKKLMREYQAQQQRTNF